MVTIFLSSHYIITGWVSTRQISENESVCQHEEFLFSGDCTSRTSCSHMSRPVLDLHLSHNLNSYPPS